MVKYFSDSPQELADFQSDFKNARKVVITSHQNPDGDAFGSGLGLYAYLKSLHFDSVAFISPTDYADFLGWMPGVSDVVVYESDQKEYAEKLMAEADLFFCLDFSAAARIKDMKDSLLASPAKKIVIDHHEQPEDFADYIFWNEKASSTCELVYQFIDKIGDVEQINQESAICLYTGLLTDTGSFKYEATSPEVHRIAGLLLAKGVVPNQIHRSLFDNNTLDRLKFLGYILNKKLVYLPEFRVCYIKLSQKELQKFNSKTGDTEGIVNYGLSMAGVVMSAIFIEKDGLIKISFRSVDDFSVSDFSREHFEGGGHKNAAGGRSKQSLEETEEKFLNLLPYYKNQLLLQPK